MSRVEVRTRVMEALARAKRRDAAELEAELRLAGNECPFDSIHLVRVAVRVARQLGLTLKPSQSIAHHFKSVEGVTTLLHDIARREAA